ncbi:MAG: IS4 family transposase [Planctomycetaceae bacterium]
MIRPCLNQLLHNWQTRPDITLSHASRPTGRTGGTDGSRWQPAQGVAPHGSALWQDAEHRAVKMHVAFGVFEQAPLEVAVTHGNGAEREQLRNMVQPGGFYVADRGYANNAMFREFDAQNVRFLIRVQENTTFEVQAEQPLSDADSQAGVVRDVLVRRLGTEHNRLLEEPLRIVEIRGTEPDQVWILATNARDLPAELIAVAYRYRWQIELFFRWLKCVLGCRHLLSHCESGVTLQVYAAVIASLLISLWTGSKPTKRTWEMLCHYFSGWATLEELHQHLNLPHPATHPANPEPNSIDPLPHNESREALHGTPWGRGGIEARPPFIGCTLRIVTSAPQQDTTAAMGYNFLQSEW